MNAQQVIPIVAMATNINKSKRDKAHGSSDCSVRECVLSARGAALTNTNRDMMSQHCPIECYGSSIVG